MTHYAKRRAEGRCISCPALNSNPEHARCPACRDRYKKRHIAYKVSKKCPDCGGENSTTKSRCTRCLNRKVKPPDSVRTVGQTTRLHPVNIARDAKKSTESKTDVKIGNYAIKFWKLTAVAASVAEKQRQSFFTQIT